MNTPLEARCDHCKQIRPLFLYEPDHNMHLGGGAFTCRWCSREKQPLLCVRCWGAERELEENDPELNREGDAFAEICETNSRVIARKEARAAADRAACEGIAAATDRTGDAA